MKKKSNSTEPCMIFTEIKTIPDLKRAIQTARFIEVAAQFGSSGLNVRISKYDALRLADSIPDDTLPQEAEMPCGYFGVMRNGILSIG